MRLPPYPPVIYDGCGTPTTEFDMCLPRNKKKLRRHEKIFPENWAFRGAILHSEVLKAPQTTPPN